MIRQRDIRDSLGLSGNVAVLQLWTVERLGLADSEHHIVFPRIINWPSLKLRSNKIEDLFKRKEDRGNPIIRAALHLEEGPIPEDDGHELGLSWEEVVMKKIEDNRRKMVEMNKELRTLAAMGDRCGVDVDVERDDGQGDDGEGDDVEGDDGKADDGHVNGGANEEAQCFETVIYTDVGGCLEEEKEDVEDVLDVAPLVRIVARHHEINEDGHLLNGILFATSVFMFFERRSTGVVKRICFSPLYATNVLIDSRKRKSNRKVWSLNDYSNYFQSNIIRFDDIVNAEFVSAITFDIMNLNSLWMIPLLEMFTLDSFGHKRKERQKIDNVIAQNLAMLFGHLLNSSEHNKPSLDVQHLQTPIQPNKFDCGVIVLKIMELWMTLRNTKETQCPLTQLKNYNKLGSNMFVNGFWMLTTCGGIKCRKIWAFCRMLGISDERTVVVIF
ncbi:uncharacterized protein LOC124831486 [Vigna umbellata]|uniref:uncharacterized protein LOC124831486 n=1 Tax=Vigna umbellata TaxID=87088 RepID=UPI001F5EADFE|nr:uncharacterized protein LOC124831486 [Vigna umbellata]